MWICKNKGLHLYFFIELTPGCRCRTEEGGGAGGSWNITTRTLLYNGVWQVSSKTSSLKCSLPPLCPTPPTCPSTSTWVIKINECSCTWHFGHHCLWQRVASWDVRLTPTALLQHGPVGKTHKINKEFNYKSLSNWQGKMVTAHSHECHHMKEHINISNSTKFQSDKLKTSK